MREASGTASFSESRLFAIFAAEIIVLGIGWIPSSLGFDRFAFCDQGANLTVQYLISHGLRPAVDFGYAYGLIPLAVGKAWFGLMGATPLAFQALIVVCGILMALGLAQIAIRLQLNTIGIALLVIALGFIIQASYPSLSQATEQVLLTFAIAQQAAGRRRDALALATGAAFAKPSMAYVYGLILTLLILSDLLRSRGSMRMWVRAFAPAAITGLVLSIILGIEYGASSLLKTLFPVEGLSNYKALGFGFFTGSGRAFWDLGKAPWPAYFLEMPAFWIASTLFLLAVTPFAALRWYRSWRRENPPLQFHRAEVIVTCAILHVVFITTFFGNEWSWFYYAYMLVIGIAIAAEAWPIGRRAALVLCALGAITFAARTWSMYYHWTTDSRNSMTAGLWISPTEAGEWNKVDSLIHNKNTVVLDINGALELMRPGFAPPTTLYLLPGLMQPDEVDRKLAQLDQASLVLVPSGIPSGCRGIPDNPDLRNALNSFQTEWKGKYYEILSRSSIPNDDHFLSAPRNAQLHAASISAQ